MVLSCCATFAKYALFFFNIIFFLGGAAVLGVGIWLAVDKEAPHVMLRVVDAIRIEDSHEWHEELTPNVLFHAAWIMIAAGALVFIIGFLGCCGAKRESQCCLSLYAICLMVILGLEIAAGVYAAVAKNRFETQAQFAMVRTLEEYYTGAPNRDGVTYGWNRMMAELGCCGVRNYADFNNAQRWRVTKPPSYRVPVQCCKLRDNRNGIPEDPTCPQFPTISNSYMDRGCYEALKQVLRTHLTVVIVVCLAFGLSQLIGIVLAFILCCSVGPDKMI